MSNQKIKTAYRQSKNIYDDVLTQKSWFAKLYIGLFWGVDDNQIAARVLSYVADDFAGKLLDVPVGTAVFTQQKYQALKNAEIFCVDYSEAMLEQARLRLATAENKHIICQQGDVANLNFTDDTFDIVISMNGVHVFPDKGKALDEMTRVLKVGGNFIGCFYVEKENRRTDFIVKHVLAKKGWFTPPFYDKAELLKQLQSRFSKVELFSERAMVWFCCTK